MERLRGQPREHRLDSEGILLVFPKLVDQHRTACNATDGADALLIGYA
jgi:hypothetical protein